MPKPIWVALPLLGVLLWLAATALRRRRLPARRTVHMVGSVLLMGYLATTACLGIFWVANQQLPVFDWHYLFGYTTLLLVALHLWFNLPRVWRWWRPHDPALAPGPDTIARHAPPVATAATPRRPWLAALGVGAIAVAAYALGQRQGRREHVASPASSPAPPPRPGGGQPAAVGAGDPTGMAFVERFHDASSTSRAGMLLRLPGGDWGTAPPPFKTYAGAGLALPAARGVASRSPAQVDARTIGSVLWHTAGITARRAGLALRASPSSGALFSTELYVAVRAAADLSPGWWHYDAQHHRLHRLSASDAPPPDDDALGAPGEAQLRGAPVVVLATAVFGRTGHKYRDRTYRYVLADLGHALENLRSAAAAQGLEAALLPRFDDRPALSALGLDGEREGLLAIVALHRFDGVETAFDAPPLSSRWQRAALADPATLALGLTGAMHRASSLHRMPATPGQAIEGPAAASGPAGALAGLTPAVPVPSGGFALPPAPIQTSRRHMLELIASRRSQRRFAATPLPLAALSAVLRAMRSAPPALSAAVRIQLVAHAVDGLPPGAYRLGDTGRLLEPRGSHDGLRHRSRAAALDQDVIGDAAAVLVLSIDRTLLAGDALGAPRAYRHAMLEAGLIGERIYLEGAAQGLGVCAVGAFFDDEAAALVGVDRSREWVVHFAALGVPLP
jgi:SagB-type dehydrogenase family enzyme